MRRRTATGGEQGIIAPTFPGNTSHLLGDAVPVNSGLTAADTQAWGEGLVAPLLPIVEAIIAGALGGLLDGCLVIQTLVAKRRL